MIRNPNIKFFVSLNPLVVIVRADISHLSIPGVIFDDDLKSYLREFEGKDTLSEEEINDVYEKLTAENQRGEISNREHVEDINEKKKQIDDGICLKCGGKLINLHGKYGDFIECENYQKCSFIKKK